MDVGGRTSKKMSGKKRTSKRGNIYEKKYTDEEFEKGEMDAPGRKFGLDHYDKVIDTKTVKKGYYIDENGKKKVLFVLMKKVINRIYPRKRTTIEGWHLGNQKGLRQFDIW